MQNKNVNKQQNKQSSQASVSGSTCITETRKCGNCKHFKLDLRANLMGTCSKKLMTVLKDMFINYKKEEGTCFE